MDEFDECDINIDIDEATLSAIQAVEDQHAQSLTQAPAFRASLGSTTAEGSKPRTTGFLRSDAKQSAAMSRPPVRTTTIADEEPEIVVMSDGTYRFSSTQMPGSSHSQSEVISAATVKQSKPTHAVDLLPRNRQQAASSSRPIEPRPGARQGTFLLPPAKAQPERLTHADIVTNQSDTFDLEDIGNPMELDLLESFSAAPKPVQLKNDRPTEGISDQSASAHWQRKFTDVCLPPIHY
jgi:hypothetical protein